MILRGSQKTVFVTGTDTGVGKTVATVSLLHLWRRTGLNALAMKPFCTGNRADVEAIQAVQENAQIPVNEVNPFFFARPVSPYTAQRKRREKVGLGEVIARVNDLKAQCDVLLIEGVGGLMVPLGESYGVRDLIACLRSDVLVVAQNRLGTLNHTLLTVASLRDLQVGKIWVVLMEKAELDVSSKTNLRDLRELLPDSVALIKVPYLGPEPEVLSALENNFKKMKKVLAPILG